MVVTSRWRLLLYPAILGAEILRESAAQMVSVVSLVLLWWLMSVVPQHEAVAVLP
jgi:hypothetical protein